MFQQIRQVGPSFQMVLTLLNIPIVCSDPHPDTHNSDIVSDISSGNIYDILSGIISGIISDICSDIQSGRLYDILSDIYIYWYMCIYFFFLA